MWCRLPFLLPLHLHGLLSSLECTTKTFIGAIGGPDCPYAVDQRVFPHCDPPVDPGNGLADARAVRVVPKPRVHLAHHDTD